jgi:hypothetical protein
MTEQFSSAALKEETREKPAVRRKEPASAEEKKEPALSVEEDRAEEAVADARPRRKLLPSVALGAKGRKKKEALEQVPAEGKDGKDGEDGEEGDFLTRGPDEDFSILRKGREKEKKDKKGKKGRKRMRVKGEAVTPAGEKSEAPEIEGEAAAAKEAPDSDEDLLQDVVSTLLKPEGAAAGAAAATAEKSVEQPAPRARASREERAERWSFLSQPRSSQYTILADKWWKVVIFIFLMLLLGAVLWAVPNAYLIPGDMEYGIHAVAIGIILGLIFWWKAGKAHSTKLAVQAGLTTLFALFIGEFLHWFLIIMKHSAFRTIFFDLISFKFIWENGAEIMEKTVEAMFPWAFTWILILPTLVAFVIAYGMPPIPEIFFQIWRALKGESPRKEEAGHGVEG